MTDNGKGTSIAQLVAGLKKKEKKDLRREPPLPFTKAATEIAHALKIEYEAATMTLYGLCATTNVRCLNERREVFNVEKCKIEDFGGEPKWVVASDVRSHLTDWSSGPQPEMREAVIAAMLAEGLIPGRNINWKKFYDQVRDKCNGWIVTRGKRGPNRGFGDKQIQRIVNDLRAK